MKARGFIFLQLLLISVSIVGQTITTTPVTGAVTENSAKLLFFTKKESKGVVHVYLNQNTKYELSFPFQTTNQVAHLQLNHLQPDYIYQYDIQLNGDSSHYRGSFKTFPHSGYPSSFSFTFGSCTEQHHRDSIFIEMQKQHPLFFLHLGDWLYSDNLKNGNFYYLENIERVKEIYQLRYTMPNLSMLMQHTPIDYIFDDEDGVHDDFSKSTYSEIQGQDNRIICKEIPYDTSYKQRLYMGMNSFFPSYPEVNTKQAYHSFVCGNAEFFILDTRSTRSPNLEVLQKKGKYWKYRVPENHTILDTAQQYWLKRKLKDSKAQWKFIISGVTFNASYKKLMNLMLLKPVQNKIIYKNMTGAYIAASLSTMWFAFPESQTELINYCADNQIKNVIVLSGDAHTAAIDDGANSGFPELMAASLAQENSKLAGIIYNQLKLDLWNKGGQGINNTNYNDAFGKVTVNGNSSVTLSAIDTYGNLICSYDVKDGYLPKKINYKKARKISFGNKVRAAKQAFKISR